MSDGITDAERDAEREEIKQYDPHEVAGRARRSREEYLRCVKILKKLGFEVEETKDSLNIFKKIVL